MRLTYVTALDKNVEVVRSNECIQVAQGETLAVHHTADFVIKGKAKVVADAGTVFYTS